MTVTQFTTNIKPQATGTALRRKKGFKQMLFNGRVQWLTVAPDPQADAWTRLDTPVCLQADLYGIGSGADVALGVVEQVDQNAAQVFRVKPDPGLGVGEMHRDVRFARPLRLPVP